MATEVGVNYIGLDGEIGCMVNGAGLAMASMDIIELHGGSAANFLDVGGGATSVQVKRGFEILLAQDNVKAIFVNIFAGILQCDMIAEGFLSVMREIHVPHPVVVRLSGTNSEKAEVIIAAFNEEQKSLSLIHI